MTRLKDATFEAGSLTGTDGFTSTTGTPALNTASKIKGVNCVDFTWTNAQKLGTVSSLNEPELFISVYINVVTFVAVRIINVSNGTTQLNVLLTATGQLQVKNGTTTLFTSSANLLTANTTYRIGFHVKVSSALANADGLVDLYYATGDAAFGTALYSASNITMITSAGNYTTLTFGNTNSTTTSSTIYMDDVRIDNAAMPGPSTSSQNYSQAANITVGNTTTVSNNVGKPIALTITDSIATIKEIGKPITLAATSSVNIAKTILKVITDTVNVAINANKSIGKPININETVAVVVIYGRAVLKTISISITSLPLTQKTIGKTANISIVSIPEIQRSFILYRSILVTTQLSIIRAISKALSLPVTTALGIYKGYYQTASVSVTLTITSVVEKSIAGLVKVSDFIQKNTNRIITTLVNRKTISISQNRDTIIIQDTNDGSD